MNAVFDDERLSGYLDGELSPDERRSLEARLAQSADLRQALDELCALGAAVKGLPWHRLEEGFSSAVLRRAEMEMLTGRSADGVTRTAAVAPAKGTGKSAERRPFNFRALLWTAATIGAAAVLWHNFQTRRNGVDVAREPVTTEKREARETPDANEFARLRAPASEVAPGPPARDGDSRLAAEREGLADRALRPDAKRAEVAADLKEGLRADRRSVTAAGQPAPADSRAAGASVQPLDAQTAVSQLADTLTASDSVVVCEITPEAAGSGLVYELLAANSIHPADESHAVLFKSKESMALAADFKREKRTAEPGAASARAEKSAEGKSGAAGKSVGEVAKAEDASAGPMPGTDMLEIEATPDQIIGFLAQMRQRPAQVTAVHQLQRANVPLTNVPAASDVMRKSVTLKAAERAIADADDRSLEEKKSSETRRSRNGVAKSRKSAPAVAAPAEAAPAEAAPASKSATESAEVRKDAAKEPAPKATIRERAKPDEAAKSDDISRLTPPAPSTSADQPSAAAERSKSEARGNQEVREDARARRATPGDPAGGQAAQANNGLYRRFNVQQAAPDGRGGLRQGGRDKPGGPSDDRGAEDRLRAGERASLNVERTQQQSLERQRVVVLIQVRPPVAAAREADTAPAPAAKAPPEE